MFSCAYIKTQLISVLFKLLANFPKTLIGPWVDLKRLNWIEIYIYGKPIIHRLFINRDPVNYLLVHPI